MNSIYIHLQLDFQLFRDPLVEDNPLEANHERLRVRDESLSLAVGRLLSARAIQALDSSVGEECVKACIQGDWGALLRLGRDRDRNEQELLLLPIILDCVASHALESLLELEGKHVLRILPRACFLLAKEHPLEEMSEVLSAVLLLASLELLVSFPDEAFEDCGSDTVLVELVFLLLFLGFFRDYLLRDLLL